MLFGINNQAVRVILLNIGILKTQGNEYKLHANGVESFKSCNQFDDDHLEVSYFRTKGEARCKHVKIGFCTETPESTCLLSSFFDSSIYSIPPLE